MVRDTISRIFICTYYTNSERYINIHSKKSNMKCQILKDKRTGKILDVLTPTGNKSITYEQLQSKYNYSPTDSAFYYSLTSSEQFQHFLLDDYSDAAARYISSQHLFTSIPPTLLTALAKAESTKSIQPLISYLNSSVTFGMRY